MSQVLTRIFCSVATPTPDDRVNLVTRVFATGLLIVSCMAGAVPLSLAHDVSPYNTLSGCQTAAADYCQTIVGTWTATAAPGVGGVVVGVCTHITNPPSAYNHKGTSFTFHYAGRTCTCLITSSQSLPGPTDYCPPWQ